MTRTQMCKAKVLTVNSGTFLASWREIVDNAAEVLFLLPVERTFTNRTAGRVSYCTDGFVTMFVNRIGQKSAVAKVLCHSWSFLKCSKHCRHTRHRRNQHRSSHQRGRPEQTAGEEPSSSRAALSPGFARNTPTVSAQVSFGGGEGLPAGLGSPKSRRLRLRVASQPHHPFRRRPSLGADFPTCGKSRASSQYIQSLFLFFYF